MYFTDEELQGAPIGNNAHEANLAEKYIFALALDFSI